MTRSRAVRSVAINLTLVIPTYNERGNIARTLRALAALRPCLECRLSIVVVDDASPDGTADEVRRLQAEVDDLHLLEGVKRGLGDAYTRGFRYALDHTGAELIGQMDADGSHDPADLAVLLAAIRVGADVAIGSRYVAGGAIPVSWGWWRSSLSRQGNRLARRLLGLAPIRDCTAGYRLIRADLLRRLGFERYRVQGYAFQVALLSDVVAAGGRVRELPVCFVERGWGVSKLGWRDIIEFGLFALLKGLPRRLSRAGGRVASGVERV